MKQSIKVFLLLIPLLTLVACAGRGPSSIASNCDRVEADKQLASSVAASGNIDYMFNLGRMAEQTDYCYRSGSFLTLEPDYITAYMWFDLAMRHQHPKAAQARERVASKLTESEIDKARNKVAIWMEQNRQQ